MLTERGSQWGHAEHAEDNVQIKRWNRRYKNKCQVNWSRNNIYQRYLKSKTTRQGISVKYQRLQQKQQHQQQQQKMKLDTRTRRQVVWSQTSRRPKTLPIGVERGRGVEEWRDGERKLSNFLFQTQRKQENNTKCERRLKGADTSGGGWYTKQLARHLLFSRWRTAATTSKAAAPQVNIFIGFIYQRSASV